MSRRIVIAGVASGLACLVPPSALAQAAASAMAPSRAASAAQATGTLSGTGVAPPASTAAIASPEVTRVVITAQKRKEDIRDVPLSVSVLSSEQLKAAQITNIEDVTRNIPNVSFTTQGGPGLGTVEIRGISSQAGSATVSVYLDDVSLTTRNLYSTGTAEPRFFDISDIEVLRGPQGTLYGASSLGGTIKFISNQPDAKALGGSATATISGTQHGGTNYLTEGVLNIPLMKNAVALRIGVQHGHDSGYIDQVDPTTLAKIATGINSSNWNVVKLALKADLGNGWSITPALFAQETNTQDIDAAYQETQSGTPLPRYETSKTVREPGHDRLSLPSVTLSGDTGWGNFTGVLSGYARRFNRIQDGTSINDPSYAVVFPPREPPPQNLTDLVSALDGLSSAVQLSNKIDQTSLEMRLTSKDYDPKGGNPFTWIGGVYVSDAVTQVYDNEPVFGVNAAFAAAGVDAGDPNQVEGGFPGDFAGDSSYYSARHYHDKQGSVFGELTFHATPKLAGTVGLRHLYASQHFTREGAFFYAGPGPNDAVIDTKSTATTPSFKINWEVAPSTSLYGNVSKGFRLGGANRPVPDTALVESDLALLGLPGKPPASFGSDSLWSYEVGSKSNLFDNTMSLNLAAFYVDWKNIQQDITLPNAGFDFETNVGRATSYGLEAEMRARVTQTLTLIASAGLTHATFSADQPAFGFSDDAGTIPNVRKGDYIEGVPKASANLGFDYHFAVNDAMNAFVRGNGQWTGSSHGTLFSADADYKRPSYFTVDASAGVNLDRWEFTAFVKNATDNHTIIQHPNVQNVSEAYYLRPRTIGVTANYEF